MLIDSAQAFVQVARQQMEAVNARLQNADERSAAAQTEARTLAEALSRVVRELLQATGTVWRTRCTEEYEHAGKRALTAMKTVGKTAEELRCLLQGTRRKRLSDLMRCLIDGAYLDLSQEVANRKRFEENRENAMTLLHAFENEMSVSSPTAT